MPRKLDDDIGFNPDTGEVIGIGAEVEQNQNRIFDHPDTKPVLVVAILGEELAFRTYGPPSLEMADTLDRLAKDYRFAVMHALKAHGQKPS